MLPHTSSEVTVNKITYHCVPRAVPRMKLNVYREQGLTTRITGVSLRSLLLQPLAPSAGNCPLHFPRKSKGYRYMGFRTRKSKIRRWIYVWARKQGLEFRTGRGKNLWVPVYGYGGGSQGKVAAVQGSVFWAHWRRGQRLHRYNPPITIKKCQKFCWKWGLALSLVIMNINIYQFFVASAVHK